MLLKTPRLAIPKLQGKFGVRGTAASLNTHESLNKIPVTSLTIKSNGLISLDVRYNVTETPTAVVI
jgi:hypothetical protein